MCIRDRFKMGIINSFTFFENLNLSFNIDIRKGGIVFNGNEAMMILTGTSTKTLDRLQPRVIDGCLLYTSDAADERSSVDLGGRRIIKKKKKEHKVSRLCRQHKMYKNQQLATQNDRNLLLIHAEHNKSELSHMICTCTNREQ